ncbi:hypothetical protein M514_18392 [Trichuris suis]|uniref:Secreted protein n=1 Tax=Trichuris suis TaxID=68888 RepID=A0A085NJ74_9BILA|nr:hypothetical protein M514_18392 [Trichuris suis]
MIIASILVDLFSVITVQFASTLSGVRPQLTGTILSVYYCSSARIETLLVADVWQSSPLEAWDSISFCPFLTCCRAYDLIVTVMSRYYNQQNLSPELSG